MNAKVLVLADGYKRFPSLQYKMQGKNKMYKLRSTRSIILPTFVMVLLTALVTVSGRTNAATLADIRVYFKLDPRFTGGVYLGERWVSPDTFTGYELGTTYTVQARAEGIDTQGAPIDVSPEWIASDPDIVTVTPTQDNQVTITVLQVGMTSLTVTSQGISRELFVEAGFLDTVIKVEISHVMPVGVEFIPYPPTEKPVIGATPAESRPVAVGPAAQEGDTIDIRVALPPFSGSADVFFGLYAPAALGSNEILLLRRDKSFRPMSAGFIPWVTGASASIDESLFGDIPVAALPRGMYHLLLLTAPAFDSSLQEAFLWHTAVGVGTVVDLETTLSGSEVVDPVGPSGSGTGRLTVVIETGEVVSTLSFNNLTSDVTGAHIHMGASGTNGPAIVGLSGPTGVTAATWAASLEAVLTSEQLNDLAKGELYFQVHTLQNPTGEIRGQISYPPGAPLP